MLSQWYWINIDLQKLHMLPNPTQYDFKSLEEKFCLDLQLVNG